jgi:dipeptidyl aminopeptidase/acylaminoacyl peptidase
MFYPCVAGAGELMLGSPMTPSRTEVSRLIESNGPDGFVEDGTLVYPPNFSRDKKYPLFVYLHGGPQTAATTDNPDFAFTQLVVSHGYVFFEPNYRGSDGLGNKYQRAIVHDAADGGGRDIMAGIAALGKQGFIDDSRVAVGGWSYGGFMTSWLIGQYHIWKAAVSGAAGNSRVEQYSLAEDGVLMRYRWGGSPWKKEYSKAWEEQSPITYASAITTPTLILHDIGDPNVPISGAYSLSRTEIQRRYREIHGHSRGGALSLRFSRAGIRHIPLLARLARSILK